MHLHILGICGTFMGGVARLAIEAGHSVSGSDKNVYPPMSTQLESMGIEIMDIADPKQFDQHIDTVIVGNVMSRGYPAVETLLNSKLDYMSGPAWLSQCILRGRHTLAVAGTHGKTTTTSMLAWILEEAGLEPGFLIGGVPGNFNESARLGKSKYFVVEADEFDSAFFDKRSKFVHYRPHTLVLNNLEFDHADIFEDLYQIEKQFHHLIRTVPGQGRIILNAHDDNLARVLRMGCWSEVESFALNDANSDWSVLNRQVRYASQQFDHWQSPMPGDHNASNALAALAAAAHVGVPVPQAMTSLATFKGIARRMQLRGEVRGIKVYDDFAHHPTAITATLNGVRNDVGDARIIAVLEPRSNTMKQDVHTEQLAASLFIADQVWIFATPDLEWDPAVVVEQMTDAHVASDVGQIVEQLTHSLTPGDQVIIMSNGAFGGIHERLLAALRQKFGTAREDTSR